MRTRLAWPSISRRSRPFDLVKRACAARRSCGSDQEFEASSLEEEERQRRAVASASSGAAQPVAEGFGEDVDDEEVEA